MASHLAHKILMVEMRDAGGANVDPHEVKDFADRQAAYYLGFHDNLPEPLRTNAAWAHYQRDVDHGQIAPIDPPR